MQKRDVDTSLMQHAGIELGPHRYDATLQTPVLNRITRVRAGEVGVAHYPKWRRSLLIHAETREFHVGWEQERLSLAWGRCTPLTIVDQFGIKISGFTPSYEALGRLLKKKKKEKNMMTKIRISHMSDFSCGETKVGNDP